MKGLMSRYSGKAIKDEIFLWNRLECSKRCKKQENINTNVLKFYIDKANIPSNGN